MSGAAKSNSTDTGPSRSRMRFMEIHLSAAMLQKPYSTVEIAEMYRQFCWKPEGQRVAVSNGHCTPGTRSQKFEARSRKCKGSSIWKGSSLRTSNFVVPTSIDAAEPQIPAHDGIPVKEHHQRRGSQERAKGDLELAVQQAGRVPGALPGDACRFFAAREPAAQALAPHHEDHGQAEDRAHHGGGEDHQQREAHPQEAADHSHELDVAEAHAFDALPFQVEKARSIDEARAQGGPGERV